MMEKNHLKDDTTLIINNFEEAKELAQMNVEKSNLARCYLHRNAEVAALREKLAACEKDADRLDFIATYGYGVRKAGKGTTNLFVWGAEYPSKGNSLLDNLRAKIDDSIQQSKDSVQPTGEK